MLPCEILADAVGVAVFDGARELAPVVDGFVLMFALSEDGRLAAGFICGAQERRSGRCSGSRD
jgi:hypothetical protein